MIRSKFFNIWLTTLFLTKMAAAQIDTFPMKKYFFINPSEIITGQYVITVVFPLTQRHNLEVGAGGHYIPSSIWEKSGGTSGDFGTPLTGIGFNGFIASAAITFPSKSTHYFRLEAGYKLLWHPESVYEYGGGKEDYSNIATRKEVVYLKWHMLFDQFKPTKIFAEYYLGLGMRVWFTEHTQYGPIVHYPVQEIPDIPISYFSNLTVVPTVHVGIRIGYRWKCYCN